MCLLASSVERCQVSTGTDGVGKTVSCHHAVRGTGTSLARFPAHGPALLIFGAVGARGRHLGEIAMQGDLSSLPAGQESGNGK